MFVDDRDLISNEITSKSENQRAVLGLFGLWDDSVGAWTVWGCLKTANKFSFITETH